MTPDDIEEMLKGLTDAELVEALDTATAECNLAAETESNSDWHNACFAGVWVLGQEFLKRGIDLRVLH